MLYNLNGKRVALLVVDVQEEYFDPAGPAFVQASSHRIPEINLLVTEFHRKAQPVVYIRHAHKPDGSDVGRMGDFSSDDEEDSFIEGTPRVGFAADLVVIEGAPVITKTRYDSFANTGLHELLLAQDVSSVAIVGFMTSFCCDSTARGAHNLDFEVLFVRDAIDGPDLERVDGSIYPHQQVLDDVCAQLAAGFAEIVTADELVTRLG